MKKFGSWIPAKMFAELEPEAWTPFLLLSYNGNLSCCRVIPRMPVASDVELTAKTEPHGRIFKIVRQHGAAVLKLPWADARRRQQVRWKKQGRLIGGRLLEIDLDNGVLYFREAPGQVRRVRVDETNFDYMLKLGREVCRTKTSLS